MSEIIGRIVLDVIPHLTQRRQVIAYLQRISGNASDAQIAKKIATIPTVLFRRVSKRDAGVVLAGLRQAGAEVHFEPLDATQQSVDYKPSPKPKLAKQHMPPIKAVGEASAPILNKLPPLNETSTQTKLKKRHKIRWLTVLLSLLLLLSAIVWGLKHPDLITSWMDKWDDMTQPVVTIETMTVPTVPVVEPELVPVKEAEIVLNPVLKTGWQLAMQTAVPLLVEVDDKTRETLLVYPQNVDFIQQWGLLQRSVQEVMQQQGSVAEFPALNPNFVLRPSWLKSLHSEHLFAAALKLENALLQRTSHPYQLLNLAEGFAWRALLHQANQQTVLAEAWTSHAVAYYLLGSGFEIDPAAQRYYQGLLCLLLGESAAAKQIWSVGVATQYSASVALLTAYIDLNIARLHTLAHFDLRDTRLARFLLAQAYLRSDQPLQAEYISTALLHDYPDFDAAYFLPQYMPQQTKYWHNTVERHLAWVMRFLDTAWIDSAEDLAININAPFAANTPLTLHKWLPIHARLINTPSPLQTKTVLMQASSIQYVAKHEMRIALQHDLQQAKTAQAATTAAAIEQLLQQYYSSNTQAKP
jgi:hypothetical protein